MRTVAWVQLFSQIADRFGVPFALFVVCLGVIWLFGSEKTRDDFIREMLFGEIAGSPAARIFFVGLVLLALVNSSALFRRWSREPAEVKRLAAEKSRLQEKLIGRELSHTERGPNL